MSKTTSLKAKKTAVRKKTTSTRKLTTTRAPSTKKTSRIQTGANGRPTDYRPEYAEQAYRLCLIGYIDDQLAKFFQVSIQTLHNWRKKNPEFFDATRLGKAVADGRIAHSLFNRAIGITIEEWREAIGRDGELISLKTTKQIPGDVAAQKFWLKNRQPDKWRENFGVSDGQGGAFNLIIHEELRPPKRPPEER
tara:strand:- start:46 stop:624 length:579 start_codon:yes stop_codon:yes gene_type:complete